MMAGAVWLLCAVERVEAVIETVEEITGVGFEDKTEKDGMECSNELMGLVIDQVRDGGKEAAEVIGKEDGKIWEADEVGAVERAGGDGMGGGKDSWDVGMKAAVLEEPGSSDKDSSAISKIELSREEISEAFLFNLLALLGRVGVPLQGCCLWHLVWNVCLQAKHLTGLAGLRRDLLHTGQSRPRGRSLLTLLKLLPRTA